VDIKYPWQAFYQAALLEFRPEVLQQRIGQAETAIRQRIAELRQDDSGSAEETCALDDALQMLRSLAVIESKAAPAGVSVRNEVAS
jgi:hypothetical protein